MTRISLLFGKKSLMAALATGGLIASVSAVLVYRRLHVRTHPGEGVSALLREIEASGFDTDGISLVGNADSAEVIARLVGYMAEPEPQGTEKSRATAMEALARIGTP